MHVYHYTQVEPGQAGWRKLPGLRRGCNLFLEFFPVFFFDFFPVFLRGLVEPVICNVLDFGSITCMVFATFWNSHRSFARYLQCFWRLSLPFASFLQRFGVRVYRFPWYLQHFRPSIVDLHGICNVLDFGSILLRGICHVLEFGFIV